MELSEIRTKIDAVDDQLLDLFLERMHLSEEVAAYKNEHRSVDSDASSIEAIARIIPATVPL